MFFFLQSISGKKTTSFWYKNYNLDIFVYSYEYLKGKSSSIFWIVMHANSYKGNLKDKVQTLPSFFMLCNFSVCTNGWALFAGHYHYFNVVGTKLNQAGLFPYSMLIFSFLLHTLDTPIWMQDKSNLLKLSLNWSMTNWQMFDIQIYRWMCETNNCTFVSFPYLPCNFYFFKTYKFSSFLQKSHALYSFISCMLIVGYT